MVQSRQSPESLQYIDAKFVLERDIGVKFCISLFTEFSLYYLKGMKTPFFRGPGQHLFPKNRRHPSAWLPAVFCLTDGNCQWLWCPIKALITHGAFKIRLASVDFWASNMESSHTVAFPLGSTDSHVTARPCCLWSGCWTSTHTSAQSSSCHRSCSMSNAEIMQSTSIHRIIELSGF